MSFYEFSDKACHKIRKEDLLHVWKESYPDNGNSIYAICAEVRDGSNRVEIEYSDEKIRDKEFDDIS